MCTTRSYMTINFHMQLRRRRSYEVLSTSKLHALDASSRHAAMLIQEMINTLADTNANAEMVFKQMASLRSAMRANSTRLLTPDIGCLVLKNYLTRWLY